MVTVKQAATPHTAKSPGQSESVEAQLGILEVDATFDDVGTLKSVSRVLQLLTTQANASGCEHLPSSPIAYAVAYWVTSDMRVPLVRIW